MSSIRRYPAKSAVIGGLILLILTFFIPVLLPGIVVQSAPNATFTVNSSGDAADPDLDDSLCDTNLATIAIHECTLRAAIQQSNVLDSHDTITFDNVIVIAPLSELPALTNDYGVTIDGNGSVFLSGINAGNSAGLTLNSNNTRIVGMIIFGFADGVIVTGQNNVIGTDGDGVDDAAERNVIYSNQCTGCTGYGIQLSGSNNIVAGNYIGVTTNGEDSGPNKIGVYIDGDGNRIGTDGDGISDMTERNVISGNSQHGIDISGDNNVVAGNYIGLKKDGDEAQANNSSGIAVDVLAAHTLIGTDSDGNGDANERNIISGNASNGITNQGDYTVVAGNYIGTNALGTSAIPNGGYGVVVTYSSYDVQIGTNGDGTRDHLEGNTISGNILGGVAVTNVNNGTWIAGNKIGTNPGGTAEIANQGDGVYAEGGDAGNLLVGTNGDGTADVNERNIISGNVQDGVHLSSGLRFTMVAGNYIGTDVNGTTAIGNGSTGY